MVLAVVIRFAAGGFDKGRIAKYVEDRSGRVISISWAPFGKGWFGEKNDRLYEVVYYDRSGNQRFATCKTSLLSGVYWTEDRVSHRRPADLEGSGTGAPEEEAGLDETRRLKGENERLRAEIRELRREHDEKLPPARR